MGGPGLASTFMRLGLIDEFWLYLNPIVLGGGKAMFRPLEERIPVTLIETKPFKCGITLLRYRKSHINR